jgi:hypothetical protein
MSGFDSTFWNLCQAAVWCEFRDASLVDEFAQPDADAYKALHWYPSHWPEGRKQVSDGKDLDRSLRDGTLTALGVRASDPVGRPEVIGPIDWQDLLIEPPSVRSRRNRSEEPWRYVSIRREDALRLWPRISQRRMTPQYDWDAIKAMYDEIMAEKKALSGRAMAEEISHRHFKRFGRNGPSRTMLDRKLKTWKQVDTR